jgi:hypothetical protein
MKTKRNYIWDSLDTDNLPKVEKNKINTNWKGDLAKIDVKYRRNRRTKIRKERKYARVPKKYKVYIKSKWWRQRKNRYYQDFGKKCMLCGSAKFIDLHHIEYKSSEFGFEKDKTLIALCRNCHAEFHLRYKLKQNMQKEMECIQFKI